MRTRRSIAPPPVTCGPIPGSVLALVLKQSLGSRRRALGDSRLFWEAAVRRLPAVLEEQQIRTSVLKTFDKAFACTWVSGDTVVFGTKDDKVVLLDANTLLVKQTVLLPLSERQPTGNPHEIPVHCGIRALEQNAGGDLLAAAGCGLKETAILSLPDCEPVLRLQGHSDWVFGATWITDRVLATGSRDKTLKLWDVNVELGSRPEVLAPTATSAGEHKGRVRAVKWCATQQELASVSTAGTLTLWDGQLRQQRQVKLPDSDEVACLATDGERLYAVGHLDGVHIIDPRPRSPAVRCLSLDSYGGNRSVQFRHGLLSVGTGTSKVWFYDLRAGSAMPAGDEAGNGSAQSAAAAPVSISEQHGPRLNMSDGYLEQNATYREYFEDANICNAAYAHEWDPGGSRMLVVGGPLASGLVGSYCAMWR